jgi:hypothetical protein
MKNLKYQTPEELSYLLGLVHRSINDGSLDDKYLLKEAFVKQAIKIQLLLDGQELGAEYELEFDFLMSLALKTPAYHSPNITSGMGFVMNCGPMAGKFQPYDREEYLKTQKREEYLRSCRVL